MITLIGAAVLLLAGVYWAYCIFRPEVRRKKEYDAGSVSEYWLQQQRGQTDDRR